jgi:hypothetical protein
MILRVSVSDPDSFYPDPDPAFLAEYRRGSITESGSQVLMTKIDKQIFSLNKNIFLNSKMKFTYP